MSSDPETRKSIRISTSATGAAPAKLPPAELLLADLRKSQQESQDLINDLLRELETTKSQLADVEKYAEAKDQELKAMTLSVVKKASNDEKSRGIPRKSDILSTAAIVQKIDILNAVVFQVAVSLGKMLHRTGFKEGEEERTTLRVADKARVMIGEDMVALLAEESLKATADLNPLLVQVVLQVAITSWCKSAVSSWKFGNSSFSNLLADLYSKIRQFEDPTFSHRWRSVTRARLQCSSDDWSQNLLDGFLSVITIAGWSPREPDQQIQFEKQFPSIFKAVLDLREALGEDITSIDVELASVERGTIFNSASMDDAWGGKSSLTEQTSRIVSGTTGLGLQKIMMKPSAQGLVSKAEIVYRPRVVLECTLEEALSPVLPLKRVAQAVECVNPARDTINQTRGPGADSRETSDATAGDLENPHKNCSLICELEAVKLQLAEAKATLQSRGEGLKATQVSLTNADTLSTSDVVQKAIALNEKISQTADLLGEMLQSADRTDRTQAHVMEALENGSGMLGEQMANILAAESMNLRMDLNPLLVQVVLQTAITTCCGCLVSMWHFPDEKVEDFLLATYSKICQTEDQAVAGRWRSITRAQLRISSDECTDFLMSILTSVLNIAGWSIREPDERHRFERSLPPLFKAIQDLRKALGEDVTSMDMELAIIEAGEAFNPAYMEDAYRDARLSSSSHGYMPAPEKVSGTTGLGLHRITVKRTQKGPIPQTEMVLFPKVALERTLRQAMDPSLHLLQRQDGSGG